MVSNILRWRSLVVLTINYHKDYDIFIKKQNIPAFIFLSNCGVFSYIANN